MALSFAPTKTTLTTSRASVSRTQRPARQVVCAAAHGSGDVVKKVSEVAVAAAAASMVAGAAGALTYDELQSLTYLQVKGSGLANQCPTLAAGEDAKKLKAGSYTVSNMCIEPTSFQVKEESEFKDKPAEFVRTKLMTRLTYTLDGLGGALTVGGDGAIDFVKDNDGLDFAATTVQLPGGERVPFLFTFKEFKGKGNIDGFSGDFTVPSYRGSTFLDPKGRGGSTGYDAAMGLSGGRSDDEDLAKENIKSTASLTGSAVFSVAKVDSVTGEVAGVFESIQPSDTDLGAKVPKDVKISGLWYGQIS